MVAVLLEKRPRVYAYYEPASVSIDIPSTHLGMTNSSQYKQEQLREALFGSNSGSPKQIWCTHAPGVTAKCFAGD